MKKVLLGCMGLVVAAVASGSVLAVTISCFAKTKDAQAMLTSDGKGKFMFRAISADKNKHDVSLLGKGLAFRHRHAGGPMDFRMMVAAKDLRAKGCNDFTLGLDGKQVAFKEGKAMKKP